MNRRNKILDICLFAQIFMAITSAFLFWLGNDPQARHTYTIILHIWLGVLWLDAKFSKSNT